MPAIRVTITLPYYLRLAEGDYSGPAGEQIVRVLAPELAEGIPPQTSVQANFVNVDTADPDAIQREKARDASQLLQWTNRLLRRFRAVTRRADIVELTRAQASPFRYEVVGAAAAPEWSTAVEYEATGPQPAPLTVEQTTEAVRNGLLSGTEPSVADLFLLDAERALHQGRFREAVLFCWEHDRQRVQSEIRHVGRRRPRGGVGRRPGLLEGPRLWDAEQDERGHVPHCESLSVP